MRHLTPEITNQLLLDDPRYAADAYDFIGEALEFTAKKLKKAEGTRRHVSGAELLEGVRLFALQEFGPMAKTTLNTWGIHECRDFGNIVFNLVNRNILRKTEEDSIEDFDDGYDFHTAFRAPFMPREKRKTSKKKNV